MTSTEKAIELVQRYATPGKSKNLDEYDEIFTTDFINHSAAGSQHGLESLKSFVRDARRWMPDIEVSIDSIFANEGIDGEPWVGASVTLRGTTAEDNRNIAMREVWIFRFRENKISERWYVYDEASSSI